MFNIIFNHQFHLDNYAKSYQQMEAECRDRTSRISARLSSPGYARVMQQNSDGTYSFYRTYTADYTQYAQSDRAWVLYKVLYALFLVIGTAISIYVMSLPSTLNLVAYIGALEVLSIIPLIFLFYTMFYQISAPRRMEIRQYKLASKHLKISSLVYGFYLIVLLAVMLVSLSANNLSLASEDVLCVAGFLLDAILIFLIFGLEIRRKHLVVPNILPDHVQIIG